MEYIKVLSKELSIETGDCNIMKPCNLLLNIRDTEATITCLNVCSGIQSDVNSNRTGTDKSEFRKSASQFIKQLSHSSHIANIINAASQWSNLILRTFVTRDIATLKSSQLSV